MSATGCSLSTQNNSVVLMPLQHDSRWYGGVMENKSVSESSVMFSLRHVWPFVYNAINHDICQFCDTADNHVLCSL